VGNDLAAACRMVATYFDRCIHTLGGVLPRFSALPDHLPRIRRNCMEHAMVRGGELLSVIAMLGGREKSHTKRETPSIRVNARSQDHQRMFVVEGSGKIVLRLP